MIKIETPGDLYYLGSVIGEDSTNVGLSQTQVNVSENTINDLKDGKADAVLLGTEPTAAELKGINEYEIALDAVCIIIDENSYQGGQYLVNGEATVKTDGLKNLTSDELKDLFSTPVGSAWDWNGDYYVRNPLLDPKSWLFSQSSLEWIKQPALVSHPFYFPVGEFDTQSVIFQALGLNEKSETADKADYLDPKLHLEQEVISFQYGNQSYYPSTNSGQNFEFQLGFASRAVMTIAPQHDPVSVVSVDGINPLTDPQSVYDGTYKFSRKIYLLTRENDSDSVAALTNFLKSPSGQKLIADAGYLPLVEAN